MPMVRNIMKNYEKLDEMINDQWDAGHYVGSFQMDC